MSDQGTGTPIPDDEATPAAAPAAKPLRPPTNYAGLAAASVLTAMVFVLAGALIGTLAAELGTGPDVWKARVRLMSVSAQGQYGGILITLGLLFALSLLRSAGRTSLRGLVVVGVVGTGVWIAVLMALNIYVDITKIRPADIAVGVVLGDLAALVMAAAAAMWGFSLAGAKR